MSEQQKSLKKGECCQEKPTLSFSSGFMFGLGFGLSWLLIGAFIVIAAVILWLVIRPF
jgi:hypothetical protein